LTKHGHAKRSGKTPEYLAWKGMNQRCTNPKYPHFACYGGRGIKVCRRWRTSYENFFADMGAMPRKGLTLERDNVNGNYEPSNCRWATMHEQNRNKRSNRRPDGAKCLNDIAASAGMHPNTLRSRLDGAGLTIEQSLATPVASPSFCGPHLLTFRGKTQTIAAWCRELKIPYERTRHRIADGWPVSEALTQPKLTKWNRRQPHAPS
jgi:hypothetical protein